MRLRPVVAATLLMAGCASQSQRATETPAVAPAAPQRVDGGVMTVQEARKAGYKIVSQDGKPMYCREELKTGSHARKDMICLTAEELAMVRDAARRNVEQMQRATAIPQGK